MKKVISLFLAMLLLTGCSQPCAPASVTVLEASYPEMAPYPDESKFTDPITGIFDDEAFFKSYDAWRGNRALRQDIPPEYAFNLRVFFRQSIPVFLNQDPKNQVCSPLNIYMAMALLAEVTGRESRQEILALLNCDNMNDLCTQANQVWRAHYAADGSSACVLANSLWLNTGLNYNPDTADTLTREYYASVFQGPMGSTELDQALQNWINDQTNGLLQEQAANLKLDPQTVLALASTIYYRAKWGSEFDPVNNTDTLFHAPSGDQTVTFMNKELTYGPYYWGNDFGAVSLKLEGGDHLWLILPDEGKTPTDVLAAGQAVDLVLGSWLETGSQKALRVNLSLPKFDVSSDLHLEKALQTLGLASVFNPDTADFSPILPEQDAWLDTVSHAARVKIDEEGVEAAAYTVMMAAGAAMPPTDEMDFILDRPFLFIITSQDNLPLFAGVVNEP